MILPNPSQMAIIEEQIPPEVLAFCSSEQLLPYLLRAIQLAEECFSPISDLELELDADHESGEQRAIINVAVAMPVDQVLARYSKFTRQWVSDVPPEVRHRIGLSYDIRNPSK